MRERERERETDFWSVVLQEKLCGHICLEAIKTLALMMESLLLSNRNLKISVKGLSGFQFDLKECKSMQKETVHAHSW